MSLEGILGEMPRRIKKKVSKQGKPRPEIERLEVEDSELNLAWVKHHPLNPSISTPELTSAILSSEAIGLESFPKKCIKPEDRITIDPNLIEAYQVIWEGIIDKQDKSIFYIGALPWHKPREISRKRYGISYKEYKKVNKTLDKILEKREISQEEANLMEKFGKSRIKVGMNILKRCKRFYSKAGRLFETEVTSYFAKEFIRALSQNPPFQSSWKNSSAFRFYKNKYNSPVKNFGELNLREKGEVFRLAGTLADIGLSDGERGVRSLEMARKIKGLARYYSPLTVIIGKGHQAEVNSLLKNPKNMIKAYRIYKEDFEGIRKKMYKKVKRLKEVFNKISS